MSRDELETEEYEAWEAAQEAGAAVLEDRWHDEQEIGPPVMVECMPGVIIRPGDVLVLSVDNITLQQTHELRARVLRRMPGLEDVVVLPRTHVEGVYRDEADNEW